MIITGAAVKYFSKITAFLVLVCFGTAFVALESHSSSLCAPSDGSHELHASASKTVESKISQKVASATESDSKKSESSDKKDCHCAHSSNCAANYVEQTVGTAPFGSQLKYSVLRDEAHSVIVDGLIKPPRA